MLSLERAGFTLSRKIHPHTWLSYLVTLGLQGLSKLVFWSSICLILLLIWPKTPGWCSEGKLQIKLNGLEPQQVIGRLLQIKVCSACSCVVLQTNGVFLFFMPPFQLFICYGEAFPASLSSRLGFSTTIGNEITRPAGSANSASPSWEKQALRRRYFNRNAKTVTNKWK